MAFKIGGVDVKDVKVNNSNVNTVRVNGTTVWQRISMIAPRRTSSNSNWSALGWRYDTNNDRVYLTVYNPNSFPVVLECRINGTGDWITVNNSIPANSSRESEVFANVNATSNRGRKSIQIRFTGQGLTSNIVDCSYRDFVTVSLQRNNSAVIITPAIGVQFMVMSTQSKQIQATYSSGISYAFDYWGVSPSGAVSVSGTNTSDNTSTSIVTASLNVVLTPTTYNASVTAYMKAAVPKRWVTVWSGIELVPNFIERLGYSDYEAFWAPSGLTAGLPTRVSGTLYYGSVESNYGVMYFNPDYAQVYEYINDSMLPRSFYYNYSSLQMDMSSYNPDIEILGSLNGLAEHNWNNFDAQMQFTEITKIDQYK